MESLIANFVQFSYVITKFLLLEILGTKLNVEAFHRFSHILNPKSEIFRHLPR